jgi:ABC-2 type transport system permease protein
MKNYWHALSAEFLKVKNSRIIWVSFIAFAIAPVMGGVFMIIMADPELAAQSTALTIKAKAMSVEANWHSFFLILSQAMGIGGIMVFGFVISWIFGREYSEGTAKDLLSLPVSRTIILNAKFIVYVLWCFTLAVSNLIIGLIIGWVVDLPGFETAILVQVLNTYFITTFLTILIGTPIAFFALAGKGYLAPLGFVALTLVFAQVIAAMGHGNYFPWSIPGIYSNSGGESLKDLLNLNSYLILIATSFLGYLLTITWWNYADQHQ